MPPYSAVYPGMDVRNRFTTTLHVMNSGVLKLSRLQPAIRVYRGISAMKLPQAFIQADEFGVRGGVEYGFMSTTTSEQVALGFAKNSDNRTASTLVIGDMGMVDRGASLSWLSQYPHERGILLPPLTAMEVKDITDFDDDRGFKIRRVTVRLNCNLLSMTIEKLLSLRKRQVQELMEIVQTDIKKHPTHPDIDQRVNELAVKDATFTTQDKSTFNDNAQFQGAVSSVLSLMPKTGDLLALLASHTRAVYGLKAFNQNNGGVAHSGFISSSWDGTAKFWQLNDDQVHVCTRSINLVGASVSLEYLGSARIASGQFDGTI
eukprot:COSAG06_NODE_12262_length_1402_cov_2.223331_1_plen_317_part_10